MSLDSPIRLPNEASGWVKSECPHRKSVALPLVALTLMGCLFSPSADAIQFIAQNNMIQFTEQSFVQNVFGSHRTYSAAKQHSEEALQIQIDFLEHAVSLSDEQRSKLELAGRGDIHRFFNEYETVKRGMTFGSVPRDEWQKVWQKTQPLSTRFQAGLHGNDSLLAKTVDATLEPEQRERVDAMRAERQRLIFADNIRMTLAMLDRKLPLTREQRGEIKQMLLSKSDPPEFYGQHNMQFYVVLLEVARLPREPVRELFADTEWRVMEGLLRQAEAMERTIEMQRKALGR